MMGRSALGDVVDPRPCPLCRYANALPAHHVESRTYYECPRCHLISLDPRQRLPLLEEVVRYLSHHNERDDPHYHAFLGRLAGPLGERLEAGMQGIDYGCGPTPVLGAMLTAAGFPTVSYDPLFHPDAVVLARRYDFVSCCEVIEHAHDPRALFERLAQLIRPGGTIGVMTRFHGTDAPFARWWYRRDRTHVCFFDARTMLWIGEQFGWTVRLPARHVAIFKSVAS